MKHKTQQCVSVLVTKARGDTALHEPRLCRLAVNATVAQDAHTIFCFKFPRIPTGGNWGAVGVRACGEVCMGKQVVSLFQQHEPWEALLSPQATAQNC